MIPQEDEGLRKIIHEAWPKERLRALGPHQAKLLAEFAGSEEHWDVEKLSNLLLEVETFWPEEIIPICRKSWDSLPVKKDEKPKAGKPKRKKT